MILQTFLQIVQDLREVRIRSIMCTQLRINILILFHDIIHSFTSKCTEGIDPSLFNSPRSKPVLMPPA